MKAVSLCCFLFLVFVELVHCQVPFLGACPEMNTMPDFELNRYLGKWFEAERYFSVFEFAGKCVSANYTIGEDGRLNIINKQTSSLTGIHSSMAGEVRLEERMDTSKLNVRFPSLPLWHLAVIVDAPYWVLETDYDNYSVVWSCTNFGLFSTRNVWILTRARNPTLEIMEQAYGVIDRNAISRAYFIRTDQNNCPEYYRR